MLQEDHVWHSAGVAGLGLVAAGGCTGDWDKDPKEGLVNSGMKSKGEGEKVWRWWAWVTKVSEGVRRWRKWIKSASLKARGEMGCGTGRVTSCFCQFSFGGVDVIQCSDTRGQEHLSIWGGLSWGCGHESQFRQILTGVFTGWEIRLSLRKTTHFPKLLGLPYNWSLRRMGIIFSLPKRPWFLLLITRGFAKRVRICSSNLSADKVSPNKVLTVFAALLHIAPSALETLCLVLYKYLICWALKYPNTLWFFQTPSLHTVLLASTSLQQSSVCKSLNCLFEFLPWAAYNCLWNITYFYSPPRKPHPLRCSLPLSSPPHRKRLVFFPTSVSSCLKVTWVGRRR